MDENPKDIATKILKPSYSLHNDNTIESVAFCPDGRFVIAASFEGTIKVWDIFTGRIVTVFKSEYAVQSVSCSPDGRYLLCGGYSDDNSLCLYRLTSGELVQSFKGHTDNVFFAAFSPGGNKILSGGEDNYVKLWNTASGGCISSFQAKSPLLRYNAVVFSKDAKRIFTKNNDSSRCTVFDISAEINTFIDCDDLNVTHSVDFDPAGNFLISAGGTFNIGSAGGPDFSARLINAVTGKLLGKFVGHSSFVLVAKFSPDGKRVAGGGQDKKLILWEVSSRNIINIFEGHSGEIYDIAFSPAGDLIASSSTDGTIKLWDTDSGKMIHSLEGQSFGEAPFCCTFSPDGKRILSAWNDDTFKIWDIVSGKVSQIFRGQTGGVCSVAFSPDAKFFLSGGEDKKVVLWRAVSGEKLHTFKGHNEIVTSVAFSPDGKNTISASGEGLVRVMERESGEKICEIYFFDDGEAVALTPDGFYSASHKGEKYLTLRKSGMEVEEIAKYRNKFHRPDIVAQAVTGMPGVRPRYVASSESSRKQSRASLPYLSFSGIKLSTQNQDRYLDSGENGMIEITIENQGKGASSPANLVLETPFGKKTVSVEAIEPKSKTTKSITFGVPNAVTDGQATLTVSLDAGKYSPPPKKIKVRTVAAVPPSFDIAFAVDDDAVGESMGNGNGRIEPREKVALVADISNRGKGSARDVVLELSLSGGEIHRGSCRIGNLPPGGREQGEFLFLVPADFEKDEIVATVTVREATGMFDTTLKPLSFSVHKTQGEIIDFAGSTPSIPISGNQQPLASARIMPSVEETAPAPASGCVKQYPNRYLAAFGVSDYEYMGDMSYVENDLALMKHVGQCYLGVPPEHVMVVPNPNRGTLLRQLRKAASKARGADSVSFFYFSGHGVTDPDGTFHFLPRDATATTQDMLQDTGISWNKLAAIMKNAKGRKVAFLDACRVDVPWKPPAFSDKTEVPENTAVFHGSRAGQRSNLGRDGKHSAFTLAFSILAASDLKLLDKNNSYLLEIEELESTLARYTRENSLENQEPEIKGDKRIPVFPLPLE